MKSETAQQNKIVFDATEENIGRLAVRIANTLRGKNDPSFAPNKAPNVTVVVENTDSLEIPLKKGEQKMYYRHSNYPGGIKEESLEDLMERDSREVVRRAVYGMLPKNKLRDRMITNLKLYKGKAS